jgi:trigger factor
VSPTETSSVKREIQVEVPAEEVARETENTVRKYQKLARLPGFRQGRVPASIIRQRFAEEIKTEVADHLVPRFFKMEADKLGVTPVSQPRLSDLHIAEGEPLRFTANFEILPDVRVEGYKELRAERPEVSVTDEDVEQVLERLREQHATYTPIEGSALSEGDFATISLDGKPKGGEGQPVHMDEVMVEIGGKNSMPEFSEHLRGATAGDERVFDVSYPEEYGDNRLAGKIFTYTAHVKGISQKNLPELNEEFAKRMGEFTDINQVRGQIRENLESERRHAAEQQAKDKLIDDLIRRNEFEVPDSLIERQVDNRLERGLRALASQGMPAEQMKKMDFGRLRAGQRDQAAHEVKASLLLEKIANEEHIDVSEDELDREIHSLARQANQPPEGIRERLEKQGTLDRIRARLRNEKTLDFLYRQSA